MSFSMMEDNQQDLNYKYRVAENEVYRCVMRYIQCELFQTPKVVKLTQLTSILKAVTWSRNMRVH